MSNYVGYKIDLWDYGGLNIIMIKTNESLEKVMTFVESIRYIENLIWTPNRELLFDHIDTNKAIEQLENMLINMMKVTSKYGYDYDFLDRLLK